MVSLCVHLAYAFVGSDYSYDSTVPPYQSHRRKLADTIPVMGNIRFVSEFDDIYFKSLRHYYNKAKRPAKENQEEFLEIF